MDQEPKLGLLPAVIGGGAMLVCCLGAVVFASGATWLTSWLSGIGPLSGVATAAAVGIAVVFVRRRRLRGVVKEDENSPQSQNFKGDL